VETKAVLFWSCLSSRWFTNIWSHSTGNIINQEKKEIMQNVTVVTFMTVNVTMFLRGTFHTLGESVYPEAEPEVGLASNDGRKEERMGSQQSKRALRKKFPDSVLCQPACCTFPPSFPIVSLVPIPTNPPKMMCCLVPS